MNEARIIEIFAQMAGISRETALEQTPLAIMAEDKIKGRLREDYDGSNETLLTYVAASLVNLWYSHSRASGSPTGSFSGNGISISSDGQAGVEAAKNLYDRFCTEAADILKDDGDFLFIHAEGDKDEQ